MLAPATSPTEIMNLSADLHQLDVSSVGNEAALLITCLRGLPIYVPSDTDWRALQRLAEENGVLLLAYQQLLALGADMPGHFRDAARESRAAAESLGAELEVLLQDFARHRIDVIPKVLHLRSRSTTTRLCGSRMTSIFWFAATISRPPKHCYSTVASLRSVRQANMTADFSGADFWWNCISHLPPLVSSHLISTASGAVRNEPTFTASQRARCRRTT